MQGSLECERCPSAPPLKGHWSSGGKPDSPPEEPVWLGGITTDSSKSVLHDFTGVMKLLRVSSLGGGGGGGGASPNNSASPHEIITFRQGFSSNQNSTASRHPCHILLRRLLGIVLKLSVELLNLYSASSVIRTPLAKQ